MFISFFQAFLSLIPAPAEFDSVVTTILNLVNYSLKGILARIHAVCAIYRWTHKEKIMINIIKSHPAFIHNLPNEPVKRIIVNTILVGIIGLPLILILSLITIAVPAITAQYNNNPAKWKWLFAIVIQNTPIFLLTLLFFYRGRLKEVIPILVTKSSKRSFLYIIGTFLIILILAVGFNLTSYIFEKSPEALKSLKTYISRGQDQLTLNYLFELFQFFVIYIFIAFFEEFIFRFTLYRFLRRKGLVLALLLSSILFGLTHGSYGVVGATVLGVVIALYYEYTNFFIGAVLIHAINNLLIVYYSYYITYQILQLKLFSY